MTPANALDPSLIEVVAFDADDTLWQSEDSFHAAEMRFCELLEAHTARGIDLAEALRATERSNLSTTGYGVKAFALSMIETAVTVSNGTVPAAVIGELVEISHQMLTEPVQLLAHVPEVLEQLHGHRRLVLITKGDLVHQTRKITTSGLEHHFEHVEVVLEKDPATYRRIIRDLDVTPERFCMVGNSVRSDVLPVLGIGGQAVHIPYHLTWEIETVEGHGLDLIEFESLAALPRWILDGIGPAAADTV